MRNNEYDDNTDSDTNYSPDPTSYFSDIITTTTPTTEIKCDPGFYSNEGICVNCFSLCQECEQSFNNCTKCKEGYILEENKCLSCFHENEGCEKCNPDKTCNKCYDNIFKFESNNGKCIIKEDNNNDNKIISLKYERFDGYNCDKKEKKAYFNSHFVLLNNYLYNAKLNLFNTIIITNIKNLRNLEQNEKTIEKIECAQYGESLGNSNNGYLANFQCSLDLDYEEEELISIQPKSLEIIFNNNKIIDIKNFESVEIKIDELSVLSLEILYKDYFFNKFNIFNVSNIKLKDNLTFNITGEYINSINTNTEANIDYEISLKYNDNSEINATCNYKEENNDTLFCTIYSGDVKEQETLYFIEGIHFSNQNKDKILILSNLNNETVKVPKKPLSVGAIVGITIAGIIILVPFIYYIAKYFIEKKELNNENEGNGIGIEERNRQENNNRNDGSKDIIFNFNS